MDSKLKECLRDSYEAKENMYSHLLFVDFSVEFELTLVKR
jgi:hypothetical protein